MPQPQARQTNAIRVLILGGSAEATTLARALAGRADIAAIMSLAGRTARPIAQSISTRVGGFGGIDGLATYLRAERIDILVDATHPFAARIARNADEAARRVGCRYIKASRPPWSEGPGDRWRHVGAMDAAAAAIGAEPRRVFLTTGSLQLAAFAGAPQHHYIVRSIDPVRLDHGLANATFFQAQGPFTVAKETRLMRDHHVEVLVTKNSGGDTTEAKLIAARKLGLLVIMVQRPDNQMASCGVNEAVALIEAHAAPARRGE